MGLYRRDTRTEQTFLLENAVDTRCSCYQMTVSRVVMLASLVTLLVTGLLVILIKTSAQHASHDVAQTTSNRNKHSVARSYKQGAVVSDYAPCSQIGSDIMRVHNGSATDAAIATVFCIGVTAIQASGIGGGHFITIYDYPKNGTDRIAVAINGREMAPFASSKDMFKNVEDPGRGGLAVAVPGEVMGLHEAWAMFGRLPWKQLVQPAIHVARSGFIISAIQEDHIARKIKNLDKFANLRSLLLKPDGRPFVAGDVMKRPLLAKTLERIRDGGATAFYTGHLADDVIADVNDAGGILTRQDLSSYTADVQMALSASLRHTYIVLPHLPSGGPIVQFMIRVLQGFDFSHQTINDPRMDVDVYQALIETFKFAYAIRSYLGDPKVVNMSEPMKNLTSEEFIQDIQSKIDFRRTHSFEYYNAAYAVVPDHGTAHLSVMSPDGGAVSATSSINTYFGSLVVGKRTGIIFNNEMNDFSSPDNNDDWGVRPSEANFIQGGKRPLSSMSPAILLDKVTKEPKLVIGGAGGSQICTMISLVTFLNQQLDMDVLSATDFPRVHHQLLPNVVMHEHDVHEAVLDGLRAKGHSILPTSFIAVINAIQRQCDVSASSCTCTAVGDVRRGSQPWGWG